jgi:hypothetical protein
MVFRIIVELLIASSILWLAYLAVSMTLPLIYVVYLMAAVACVLFLLSLYQ